MPLLPHRPGQCIFRQRTRVLSSTSSLSLSKVVQPQRPCKSVSFLMACALLNQLESLVIQMQIELFIDSASLDCLHQPSQTGHLSLFCLQSSSHQTHGGMPLFIGRADPLPELSASRHISWAHGRVERKTWHVLLLFPHK